MPPRTTHADLGLAAHTEVKGTSSMNLTRMAMASAVLVLLSHAAYGQGTPRPKDAELYFITPEDEASVSGTFKVRFGLSKMGVTHGGDAYPNSGHHHLLIDVDRLPDPGEPIPLDKSHLHFGAGETETDLDLSPGEHTLQLELGDANHFPFDPPVVSKRITVSVRAKYTDRRRIRHRRSHDFSPGPPYSHDPFANKSDLRPR
jgi:hypothetical protein